MPADFDRFDWKKGEGLLPAVVQDARTGQVLMLAYMNREALERTLETGRVTFWSRSRRKLWTKGETSGHWLHLEEVRPDCDADAILVLARPEGPTCHRGTSSCFGGPAPGLESAAGSVSSLEFLERLEALIHGRKRELPEGSYTTRLFKEGPPRIARKLGEEAVELIVSMQEGRERTVEESADLLYHLLVFLAQRGVQLREVIEELSRRHSPPQEPPA